MTKRPSITDMPIQVILDEGTDEVTIEWDETHPVAVSLGLDEWTEQQWIDAMEKGMENLTEPREVD